MPLITLTPFNAVIPETLTYYSYTSSLSPIAYWRLGDVPPVSIDDTFTGIDGSPPNPALWESQQDDPKYIIQNNTAQIIITDDSVVVGRYLYQKFLISNDFDYYFDISTSDVVGFNQVTIYTKFDDAHIFLSRRYNHSTTGNSFTVTSYNGDFSGTVTTSYTTALTTYKLRFVRIGTTITAYVWDGSQWTWDGNPAGYTYPKIAAGNEIQMNIQSKRYGDINSGHIQVNINEFVVNQGRIVNPNATEDNNVYPGTYSGDPTQNSTSLLQIETDNPSVSFDGVDQYVSAGDVLDMGLSDITQTFIFQPNVIPIEDKHLVGQSDGAATDGKYYSTLTSGMQILLGYDPVTEVTLTSDRIMIEALPYHIACVWDRDDAMSIYINGVKDINTLDISTTSASNMINSLLYTVGLMQTVNRYTDAIFDEVSIFDKVLTSSEISQMFALTGIGTYFEYMMSLSPIAYWRLGEATGETVAVDAVGSFNGTYVNQPTLESTNLLQDGSVDTSVYFDGIDQYVDLDTIVPTVKTHTTGSVVFVVNVHPGGSCSVGMADAVEYSTYLYFIFAEDSIWFRYNVLNGTGSDNFTVATDASYIADTTYHVVFVQDDIEGCLIYINGVLQTTSVVNGTVAAKWFNSASQFDKLSINSLQRSSPVYYNGTTDEVCIFDYKLSPSEITTMYQKSIGNF